MKTTKKMKLSLTTETLAKLTAEQLISAVGGQEGANTMITCTDPCPSGTRRSIIGTVCF